MAVVLFLLILLFLCYAVLMLFYRAGWKALPDEETDRAHEPRTKVSLIIPARNEEKNLPQLLRDVQNQHYPPGLLEIIVWMITVRMPRLLWRKVSAAFVAFV